VRKALKIELHDINVILRADYDASLDWSKDEELTHPVGRIDGNDIIRLFGLKKPEGWTNDIKIQREYTKCDYKDEIIKIRAKIIESKLLDIELTTKFEISAEKGKDVWDYCINEVTYSGAFTVWWDYKWLTEKEYKKGATESI